MATCVALENPKQIKKRLANCDKLSNNDFFMLCMQSMFVENDERRARLFKRINQIAEQRGIWKEVKEGVAFIERSIGYIHFRNGHCDSCGIIKMATQLFKEGGTFPNLDLGPDPELKEMLDLE